MIQKTFRTTVVRRGPMCFLPLPFDPAAVFGKVRAPVRVTVGGHAYRSTITSRGDGPCVPLRKSNREAAGLVGDETVRVTLTLDEAPREVVVPRDLGAALRLAAGARAGWNALSYSHRREHVDAIEQAKRPQTRARRVAAAVSTAVARAAKETSAKSSAKPRSPAPDTRPRLNADWHRAHRMPKNPTADQRLDWHVAHAAHCACRPMPAPLAALAATRATGAPSKRGA